MSGFTGTLSLTGVDAASFQIVGNNLETNGIVPAGNYNVNVVATQAGAINSPLTKPFSITGSSLLAGPPPQAVAAGFTNVVFFDDFTSDTIDTRAPGTTLLAGKNWYPSGPNPAALVAGTNYNIFPTLTASQVANGNGSGGPNASSAGGILKVLGQSTMVNQHNGNMCTVPANFSSGAQTGAWHHGYFECYLQCNQGSNDQTTGWAAYWSFSTENNAEIDFMEFGGSLPNNPNMYGGTLRNSGTVLGVEYQNYPPLSGGPKMSPEWHTFGFLWDANDLMSFYIDNQPMGTFQAGVGTTFPNAATCHLFLILGTASQVGLTPLYVDWVRVLQ